MIELLYTSPISRDIFEIFILLKDVKNFSLKGKSKKFRINFKKILSPLLYKGAFFNYVDKTR